MANGFDLILEFNYFISVPYSPSTEEALVIKNNPPVDLEDWGNAKYDIYKANLKSDHLLKQKDRCAYCRNYIEPNGYYEPIEHIVAKSIKPKWMLHPTNLIVTCDRCNNLKNDEPTLKEEYKNYEYFPETTDAFMIFNPHFDRWGDNFEIVDQIFLVGKIGTKGPETIRICKLYKYHIPVNNARQLRLSFQSAYVSIAHRLYEMKDIQSEAYLNLKEALLHFERRISPLQLGELKMNNPINSSQVRIPDNPESNN